MDPLNMVIPAVNRPAAMGLSLAISRATEWTSCGGLVSIKGPTGTMAMGTRTCLVVCSSVPAGDFGGVVDARLEAVGAEGSEAHGGCAVQGANAPVGSRGAAAHGASGCDQEWC